VGDIIVTKKVPPATLAKGQVVTVVDPDHPGKTRTHRVYRRNSDGSLVTKGDANPQPDSSKITPANVLGLGVIRVPFVGRPTYWMAERNWLPLVATTLILGLCLVSAFPRKPGDDDDAGPTDARPTDAGGTDGDSGSAQPSRRRAGRIASAAVLSVLVAGAGGAPAHAAYAKVASNPTSSLVASLSFYPYRTEVVADAPYLYWRLDEASGTTIADSGGSNHPGTLTQSATYGQTGALGSEAANKAMSFSTGSITANAAETQPDTFSVEAWVKTTSTTGGRNLGMGNAAGATASTTVDRQLYLSPDGKVRFGVGANKTTVASSAALNNGAWHHVVGTFTTGNNGMKLYVDGVLQGSDKATTALKTGYWRAGAETMSGWLGNPGQYYVGSLDELAVYDRVLTPAEVTSHFNNATN
jgi:hypothetical protein